MRLTGEPPGSEGTAPPPQELVLLNRHGPIDLPDELAAKITIHYYLDARDALLKALAI